MIKNLVIVESPAKAKTIEKFLGNDYKVLSSYGHIRDLMSKKFSIDVDNGFRPIYEIPQDKQALVAELKKAAADAQTIWLASDEDREGEAIAWHLAEVLGLDEATTKRIVFHEITKEAIQHAIENPRTIDMALVDAQQARRVLDRIVGFELSPVLWKKIKPALSAGRVQSVAVRLLVEREKEIKNFVSEPYYRVNAVFTTENGDEVKAELTHRLPSHQVAKSLLLSCEGKQFRVAQITVKPLKKSPAPPFTTSTLQQEAARKLGYTVGQTMMLAQKLYEEGHITYMRTDSVNLSNQALAGIASEIKTLYGEDYLNFRHYNTTSKGAQEAHEAIRPTYLDKRTINAQDREKRLYELIWKRTVASQMVDAELEKTTVDIEADGVDGVFVAQGQIIKRDGFLKLYIEGGDDEKEAEDPNMLPEMHTGEAVNPKSITATERYTMQPPRYTEASLVKKMEELGIGRPSTYAPTISTIQNRSYVEKGEKPGVDRQYQVITLSDGKLTETTRHETTGAEKGKLIPTDVGIVVNDFLENYFPEIVDYNFTAKVEQRFDEIAQGQMQWNSEIDTFYNNFHPAVDYASNVKLEHKVGERYLGEDPATGRPVSVKIGRFGPMVQIGSNDDDNKPQFASLPKGVSMSEIDLANALKLFQFPKDLGELEDKKISVAIGRFGPYVHWDKMYVSIPKTLSPNTITAEEAVELIRAKQQAEANKTIKVFQEEPTMMVLNGRYGPYISYNKENYKLPKTVENPAELTVEQCKEIIEQAKNVPKKTGSRRGAAKKETPAAEPAQSGSASQTPAATATVEETPAKKSASRSTKSASKTPVKKTATKTTAKKTTSKSTTKTSTKKSSASATGEDA